MRDGKLIDELDLCDIDGGDLVAVFRNGELLVDQSLEEIRNRI